MHSVNENPVNEENWFKLLLLPKVIFFNLKKNGKKMEDRSAGMVIKERIQAWRSGNFVHLWELAVKSNKLDSSKSKTRNEPEGNSLEKKNITRCLKLAKIGQYTRASQALGSAGIAKFCSSTFKILKEKHPQVPLPQVNDDDIEDPPLCFSQADILVSIKSFKAGTAPGPSGLRPEHLKAAVFSASRCRTEKVCCFTHEIHKYFEFWSSSTKCCALFLWRSIVGHQQKVWGDSSNFSGRNFEKISC